MHALYALDGLAALAPSDDIRACRDPHSRVRAHAVRLAEKRLADSSEMLAAVVKLADDDDILVRYQVALSLGESTAVDATAALARIARRDAGEPWMRVAIVSSSLGRAGTLVDRILAADGAVRDAKCLPLCEMLARQAGLEGDAAGVSAVSDAVRRAAANSGLAAAMIRALAMGLSQSKSPLAKQLHDESTSLGKQVAALISRAEKVARDAGSPPAERADAIGALSLDGRDRAGVLAELLSPDQPTPVLVAALRGLARSREEGVAAAILEKWPGMSPAVRAEAIEALFARPERLATVLAALERGDLRPAELDATRIKRLVEHRDAAIRQRAKKFFAQSAPGRRGEVVARFSDLLKHPGDIDRGRTTFRKTCAACHRLEGVGHNTGPDLAAMKNRGAEAILLALLDPNREVNPQYLAYTATTTDGRTASGMIAAETATSVTLRRGEGQEETLLRDEIDQLRSTGLSLMPERLEEQLSRPEIADLIAYLMAVK
jgi:putative heme-binding domain-containing protein